MDREERMRGNALALAVQYGFAGAGTADIVDAAERYYNFLSGKAKVSEDHVDTIDDWAGHIDGAGVVTTEEGDPLGR